MFRSTFHSVSLVLDRSRLELPSWSTGLRKTEAASVWHLMNGLRRLATVFDEWHSVKFKCLTVYKKFLLFQKVAFNGNALKMPNARCLLGVFFKFKIILNISTGRTFIFSSLSNKKRNTPKMFWANFKMSLSIFDQTLGYPLVKVQSRAWTPGLK